MSSKSFYIPIVSFFVGVAISSFGDGLIKLLVYSIFLIAYCVWCEARFFVCAFAIAFCLFGFVRMELAGSDEHPFDVHVGEEVGSQGIVCDAPVAKETSLRFCFEPDGSTDRAIVVSDRYPEFSYGDKLRIAGRLELPKNFEAYEGGPEFDYVSYLAKDGIRYVMYRPKIEKLAEGRGSLVKSLLVSWRGSFVARIEYLFAEPQSSLLSGILIGERGSLPKDVTEDFKISGLQHILVLSGYNVTIVAESFIKTFSFLPLALGRSFGAAAILFFALFTGGSATTIRASIMALIVLLSRSTARVYDISRALSLAAFLMVLHDPMILISDVSFQLSFIATLGLIYVAPLAHDKLGWVTERMNVREIISSSIGAQALVAPFLMHVMGSVSLISLVSNIFVLPVIPFSMLSGFIAVAGSLVSDPIARVVSWVAQVPLTYILFVADISAKIPFASLNVTMSASALIVTYVLIVWFLSIAWKKRDSSPPSPN